MSMAGKRQCGRHIVKLPVTISAGEKIVTGTTVRVSKRGFFVRTQQSFAEGVPVEIVLSLTDIESCKLKGVVKYVRNFDLMPRQNGMGIELTERDDKYEEFIAAAACG